MSSPESRVATLRLASGSDTASSSSSPSGKAPSAGACSASSDAWPGGGEARRARGSPQKRRQRQRPPPGAANPTVHRLRRLPSQGPQRPLQRARRARRPVARPTPQRPGAQPRPTAQPAREQHTSALPACQGAAGVAATDSARRTCPEAQPASRHRQAAASWLVAQPAWAEVQSCPAVVAQPAAVLQRRRLAAH